MSNVYHTLLKEHEFLSNYNFSFSQMKGGGSDRIFYRILFKEDKLLNYKNNNYSSIIAIFYNKNKSEDKNYANIAKVLKQFNLNVPSIFFHDKKNNIIFCEDLGDIRLFDIKDDHWQDRKLYYQLALDQIIILNKTTKETNITQKLKSLLQPPFNAELYQWEQNYFFDEFVSNFCEFSVYEINTLKNEFIFGNLIKFLTALPTTLVHRDYQSQNIMINHDEQSLKLIDFQGIRMGHTEYDIASLIYDPYVNFSNNQRQELIDYFFEKSQLYSSKEKFCKILYKCAAQRLMQALGAYGFLSLKKGKTSFQKFIPSSLENLIFIENKLSDKKSIFDTIYKKYIKSAIKV